MHSSVVKYWSSLHPKLKILIVGPHISCEVWVPTLLTWKALDVLLYTWKTSHLWRIYMIGYEESRYDYR